MNQTSTGPLDGLLVIDQTQAMAGPWCAMMLGDMGADVIKIEKPGAGDQSRAWGPPFLDEAGVESAYYLAVNRNKRCLALNVAHAQGQAVLHRLATRADVFLTNMVSLAALQKYTLDYATLAARNPRLIYCAISGYGLDGPRAGQAGYDMAAQAEAGPMYYTGDPAGPPMRFPAPMADMTTALFGLSGILAALHARATTGLGQLVDVSLLESQMTWLTTYAADFFATGEAPPRRGNRSPQVSPYEPMQAADGMWLVPAVGSDNTWRKFCALAGLEHLRDDPRFATNADRVRNADLLLPQVHAAIATRPGHEWLNLLHANGIPCGQIRDLPQALADPQVAARGLVVETQHPTLGPLRSLATPIHLSATPLSWRTHAPRLGEHSDEILAAFDYTPAEIAALRADGIVG